MADLGYAGALSQRCNPFQDRELARQALYGSTARVTQRTSILKQAKVAGDDPLQVIVDMALFAGIQPGAKRLRVLDVGCGRGGTTARLADDLQPTRLVALDLSPALLNAARQRTPTPLEC